MAIALGRHIHLQNRRKLKMRHENAYRLLIDSEPLEQSGQKITKGNQP